MEDDVKRVVGACLTCQRHQKVPEKFHPAQAIAVDGIFDEVGIDLVFGLPKTKDNYCGLFVLVQKCTKYPFAVPIKSKEMVEIVKCFITYISIFGPPKSILTDQGKEFNNSLMAELLVTTGIEHKVTSAYNPRTNGMTERLNQTLIEALRKHTESNP